MQSLFARSARGKAEVMVQFHYSPSLLEEVDPVTKKLRQAGCAPWAFLNHARQQ